MATPRDADEAALAMVQRPSRHNPPGPAGTRVHDAVDLASGSIGTTTVNGPLPVTARLQRLQGAGFPADPSVLAGPRYRLTARRPFQAKPKAWLDAFFDSAVTGAPGDYFGVYATGQGDNSIWWRVPSLFPNLYWATCNFTYAGLPAGQAVMTLNFEVWPYQDATGEVVVFVGAQVTEIPVTAAATRSVDIGFVHNGDPELRTSVLLRQGIYDFVFHSVVLQHS